ANGSRAANAGAPRQLCHHRPETCRRVQGGAHHPGAVRCHAASQRACRRFSHRLPESSGSRPVFRRVRSNAVTVADDPVVSGMAALAALSTLCRDGINCGSLSARGMAATGLSRNRLHEFRAMVFGGNFAITIFLICLAFGSLEIVITAN